MRIFKSKGRVIVSIIITVIFIIIVWAFVLWIKFKNSYIFNIGNAFNKTLSAKSSDFLLEYTNGENKIDASGSIEYNFKNLDFLVSCESNNEQLVLDISKNKSIIAYYVNMFNKWITMDVSEIADDILTEISNVGEGNFIKSFPVQKILKLISVDEMIDISNFPNKLTRKFMLDFFDEGFIEEVLKCNVKSLNDSTTYLFKPNIYELLKEFIETSSLNQSDIDDIISKLNENKKELEQMNLEISITIDKNGYITEFSYSCLELENIKSIDLKLENINSTSIELDDKLVQKLEQ